MRKLLVIASAAFVAFAVSTRAAEASPLTIALNCTLNVVVGPCGAPTGPFGSVVITDNVNANLVDFLVTLTGSAAGQTVSFLALNFNGPISGTFLASGGNIGGNLITTVNVGVNSRFDIRIDPSGNVNPLWFTLSNATMVNLDPSMFALVDSVAGYNSYVDVNAQVGGTGTEFRYGSTSALSIDTQAAPVVPEPASLSLLGLGLAGLAARKFRARKV